MKQLAMAILFMFSVNLVPALAQTGEDGSKVIWSCKAGSLDTEYVLWLVEWGPNSYIRVFDERIPAQYGMDGLDKRWDWDFDLEDGRSDFAITLTPEGRALYFDFSMSADGSAKPRKIYYCSK